MGEAIEIALGAAVRGDEGFVGEVERIDLDRAGRSAVQVVVRPRHEGGAARLIPVAALRTDADGLRLPLTLEGFEEFPSAEGQNR
jgi:hypothetical protein